MDWNRVREIIRERLGGDTRFEGWRVLEGFEEEWRNEYPLDVPDSVLRNPPRCDGWLFTEKEGSHLVLLEFEQSGGATRNIAKLLWYDYKGGTFQELPAFAQNSPGKVSIVQVFRKTTEESEYEEEIISYLGGLFERTGGGRNQEVRPPRETQL